VDRRLAVCSKVALCVKSGDIAERANAAVLLGAYLLLRRAWSLAEVDNVLSQEAMLIFPCSWSGRSACRGIEGDVLQVRDCWAGLELARRFGWLDLVALRDEKLETLAMSQYRQMALQYDAVWISPGEVMVSADPMSSIRDPNPSTCSALLPTVVNKAGTDTSEDGQFSLDSPLSAIGQFFDDEPRCQRLGKVYATPWNNNDDAASEGTNSTATLEAPKMFPNQKVVAPVSTHSKCSATTPRPWGGAELLYKRKGEKSEQLSDGASSCHTVCKHYCGPETWEKVPSGSKTLSPPKDFASFLLEKGVGLVVRANFGDEAGLVEHGGTYKALDLVKSGLEHLELPVVDLNGGVPSWKAIGSFISACDKHKDSGQAILVHCKGGFGRSIVLICCLLIHRLDVPGRALLGWVRIVRPGAVTTSQQERFLCSLSGRAELHRLGKFKHRQEKDPSCCVVS